MDLTTIREQIPVTRHVIYMNTGWSGPSPLLVVEAITRRLTRESYEGPTSRPVMEERMAIGRQARQGVARLMGATPEEIVLCQNTTDGINIALNGLPFEPGDQVITCNLEHSSGIVPLYYLRQRHGVELKVVRLSAEDTSAQIVDKFAAAVTERTRLFLVSHISYSNGQRLPLSELNRLAHSTSALVIVDGAQTAGHIALDMTALECDFYAIPGHKWLLGPDGVGALFIRRDLIERVEPMKVAGRAAAYYDFEGGFEPRRDVVEKFELTTSSGALLAGFATALELFESPGQAQIEERILHLASLTRQRLGDIPDVSVVSPRDGPLTSGLVCFTVEGIASQDVTAQLWQQGKVVCRSVRETPSTRLSLHFFNTEEEVETVAGLVRDLALHGLPSEGQTDSAVEEQAVREL